MRAFFAIELPPAVRAALASLQRQLAASKADVTWVNPTNLHLTMRFLGDITDAQRQDIEAGARRIAAAGMAPFHVSLATPGAFPSTRAPRVLWVSIEHGKEQLTELAKKLEQESVAAGLTSEERGFVAHVTIGRTRSSKRLLELSHALSTVRWQPPPAFTAETVTLVQSTLQSGGPIYAVLARLPFRKCQTLPKTGEVSDTS